MGLEDEIQRARAAREAKDAEQLAWNNSGVVRGDPVVEYVADGWVADLLESALHSLTRDTHAYVGTGPDGVMRVRDRSAARDASGPRAPATNAAGVLVPVGPQGKDTPCTNFFILGPQHFAWVRSSGGLSSPYIWGQSDALLHWSPSGMARIVADHVVNGGSRK